MIWHIFGKDCRLLYPFALVVAAIHLVNALVSVFLGAYLEPRELRAVLGVLPYVSMLGVIALTASVVHQDPLPDTSEDFLVRPIHRRDLLLAKLLFIGLIVLGPVLIADILESALSGFDLWISLSAAFADVLSKFLLFALPAMAVAAVSRNLTELIAGSLLLVAIGAALLLFLAAARGTVAAVSTSGLEWVRPAAIALAFLLIGALVLPTQYMRRATFRSRGMIALGGVLAAMLWMFIPWAPSFAVQQKLTAQGDPNLKIEYAPQLGRFREPEGRLAPALRREASDVASLFLPARVGGAVSLFVPLEIQGVPADSILFMDRAIVRISDTTGRTLFEGASRTFSRNSARVRGSALADEAASVSTLRTYQELPVPASLLSRLKSTDVHVDIDYSFSLMAPEPAQTLSALRGDVTADGRRCRSRSDEDGDDLQVGCLSPVRAPSCVTVYLQHDVTGTRNPPKELCQPDYSPYPLTLEPHLVKRFGVPIPFYDPARSASYPVSASMLKQSHVVIVPYEAVSHTTRHLSIPAVRISDLQGES